MISLVTLLKILCALMVGVSVSLCLTSVYFMVVCIMNDALIGASINGFCLAIGLYCVKTNVISYRKIDHA